MSLRIAVTGSTGLIGTCVANYFSSSGCIVVRCIRPQTHTSFQHESVFWDPVNQKIDFQHLTHLDALIHLSGVSIVSQRWTPAYKQEILESRCQSTRLLVEAFRKIHKPPKLFVCASAVGYYGCGYDDSPKGEGAPSGQGFLADVCREWEAEALRAQECGVRVVCLRFGAVVAKDGGMLKAMLPAFQMGAGTVLGSGKQPMSWIAPPEIPRIIHHIIQHPEIHGPVNSVSPQGVTNKEFSQTLAQVLHRPCLFRAPEVILRMMVGELADEVLLSGRHVVPKKLLDSGYIFQESDLKTYLSAILGK